MSATTTQAAAKKSLALDNLDDRRELVQLLGRLSPVRRIAFLRWACLQSWHGKGTHPEVQSGHSGETIEVFFDLWSLAMQYGLDMDKAANKLVEVVRRQGA